MELYVIRHAKARDAGPGEDDAARPLTAGGAKRFRRVVSGLGELGVELDLVLHSPWRRALETAELLSERCVGEVRVDALLAQAPSRALFSVLETCLMQGHRRIALVGHQPWLGELVAWGLTGATNAASAFHLRKGAVVHLGGRPAPGGMTLRALLPPSVPGTIG